MGTAKDSEKTRKKLIEAAGQLFARKGYSEVTVRDIAKKADTHLSALNYHFRTKEALYHEVVMEACKADSVSSKDKELLLNYNPKEALFLFVKKVLADYRKQKKSNWKLVLVAKECKDPSHEFCKISEVYLKPETNFLSELIGRVVNKPSADYHVRFAVMNLIALLETFGLYNHLIDVIAPGLDNYFKNKNALTKHIVHLVIEAANPKINE